jgi:hypothetical protein
LKDLLLTEHTLFPLVLLLFGLKLLGLVVVALVQAVAIAHGLGLVVVAVHGHGHILTQPLYHQRLMYKLMVVEVVEVAVLGQTQGQTEVLGVLQKLIFHLEKLTQAKLYCKHLAVALASRV